jgi:Fe-S cluster biogenesis protein NfuA
MSEIAVFSEATPNPQSLKFLVSGRGLSPETVNFTSAQEAARSPLAAKIFGFPWAAGVFLGPDFVTITKQEWVDWDILAEPLCELIKEHLTRGEPVLWPADPSAAGANSASPDGGTADSADDSPVVRHIKQILRDEIRPAVAMDGGDITFHKYEQGRLFLHMHGACSGCPSSSYTLKEGIETRLKEVIPELIEVVAL